MNNPDHISESLETIFWVKIFKFLDADPGFGINIPDPQHCVGLPTYGGRGGGGMGSAFATFLCLQSSINVMLPI
jgi:hypothetical protein